ncbi:MAG: homoserine O-acetyltransferase [Nitrososphaerota archaeon]|nr:homoserine O-acetyltransferase [Nitrososphaerota archaeon]MDG6903873.1 homoserine O-acetyltransferase [Nitrososphaerota archaeon]MDG6911495.1 homoserine O-acetyltransferase [Nitrososphaerota archaeon]MDG6940397.1 homoserine O-acetyltransferase [Nitrososphaerota archaeon]MDG6960711.1 homoserine O-acetyltransferase [Nitrososphaerota archaeon]
MEGTGSVGVVETNYFTFARPPHEMVLESGERLGPITLAYETYGRLDQNRSNAILVLHALSGDAHAAGVHRGDKGAGWWDAMIGPGRALDTDRYFVICSNVLGGCRGSTGPSSKNPDTGEPYGLDFPIISIKDMVEAQRHLIDHLGIETLLSVIGGSSGGMQALQWMASYPERIRSAIPIATTLRHSPQQIALSEVGRQAIMSDPDWKSGSYHLHAPPARGLAIARMVGHITYMSDTSMKGKFGRRLRGARKPAKFSPEFEVEGYLEYRGSNFVKRFDANSYLYITKAMDHFDAAGPGDGAKVFLGIKAKVLVLAFKSDWLYPPYQSQEIVEACMSAGVDVTYCEIQSDYGHDAFLLEIEEESDLVRNFLDKVFNANEAVTERPRRRRAHRLRGGEGTPA